MMNEEVGGYMDLEETRKWCADCDRWVLARSVDGNPFLCTRCGAETIDRWPVEPGEQQADEKHPGAQERRSGLGLVKVSLLILGVGLAITITISAAAAVIGAAAGSSSTSSSSADSTTSSAPVATNTPTDTASAMLARPDNASAMYSGNRDGAVLGGRYDNFVARWGMPVVGTTLMNPIGGLFDFHACKADPTMGDYSVQTGAGWRALAAHLNGSETFLYINDIRGNLCSLPLSDTQEQADINQFLPADATYLGKIQDSSGNIRYLYQSPLVGTTDTTVNRFFPQSTGRCNNSPGTGLFDVVINNDGSWEMQFGDC
jgi:hypothetical protein